MLTADLHTLHLCSLCVLSCCGQDNCIFAVNSMVPADRATNCVLYLVVLHFDVLHPCIIKGLDT